MHSTQSAEFGVKRALRPAPCAVLLLLLTVSPAMEQRAACQDGAKGDAASAAGDDEYRIQAGDVLQIFVTGEDSLSSDLVVLPNGAIRFPFVGTLRVEGMTLTQLEEELTKKLQRRIRFPEVTVAVKETMANKPIRVYVLGAVKSPGVYEIAERRAQVLDALVRAGGITEVANAEHAKLIRANGQGADNVDLKLLLERGALSENKALKNEDMIFVPGERKEFMVVGRVSKPGPYDWREDLRALSALQLAGGVTEGADLRGAFIRRENLPQQIKVDLLKLVEDGDFQQDAAMQPGDILFVPPKPKQQILVIGEVKKPGVYDFKENMRLVEALQMAEVSTEAPVSAYSLPYSLLPKRANLKRVRVLRTNNSLEVDIDAFMKGSNFAANIPLHPDDVVIVPPAGKEQVHIFGAVAQPGPYQLDEGDRIFDLLKRAGFPKDLKEEVDYAAVIRVEGGTPLRFDVDLEGLIQQGDVRQNLLLAPGDLVVVPAKKAKRRLGPTEAIGLLYPLGYLFDVVNRNR